MIDSLLNRLSGQMAGIPHMHCFAHQPLTISSFFLSHSNGTSKSHNVALHHSHTLKENNLLHQCCHLHDCDAASALSTTGYCWCCCWWHHQKNSSFLSFAALQKFDVSGRPPSMFMQEQGQRRRATSWRWRTGDDGFLLEGISTHTHPPITQEA